MIQSYSNCNYSTIIMKPCTYYEFLGVESYVNKADNQWELIDHKGTFSDL